MQYVPSHAERISFKTIAESVPNASEPSSTEFTAAMILSDLRAIAMQKRLTRDHYKQSVEFDGDWTIWLRKEGCNDEFEEGKISTKFVGAHIALKLSSADNRRRKRVRQEVKGKEWGKKIKRTYKVYSRSKWRASSCWNHSKDSSAKKKKEESADLNHVRIIVKQMYPGTIYEVQVRYHKAFTTNLISSTNCFRSTESEPAFLKKSHQFYFAILKCKNWNGEIWAALNIAVFRADEVWNSAGMKGRGDGKTPRKPADQRHRPTRFPHAKIRRGPAGIEPGSPWWEESRLTAQPPWSSSNARQLSTELFARMSRNSELIGRGLCYEEIPAIRLELISEDNGKSGWPSQESDP
ncbi:hypothetical protein PR048_032747, partial [Dryococelus australis]